MLARENGCRIALNIEAEEFRKKPDDGRLIGEMLGLEIAISRPRKATDADAYAVMLSNGMQAEDAAMRHSATSTPARCCSPDSTATKSGLWNEALDLKIKRKDISGSAIAEYRLEVDFIQLPV